jgi:hypothetical protein
MSMRAFPISRLEVISSFADAKVNEPRKNITAKALRARKCAVKVESIQ